MKDIPEECRHVFGEPISVMAAESNVNISRAITGCNATTVGQMKGL